MFDTPVKALDRADLAVRISHHLGEAYHPEWVLDLRARAFAYLGNARRVLGELRSSESAFRRAETCLVRSQTGNPKIEAEVLDLEPRLFAYLRFNLLGCMALANRHQEALALLPEVRTLFRAHAQPADLIRLRWAEGSIAFGLGRMARQIAGMLRERRRE